MEDVRRLPVGEDNGLSSPSGGEMSVAVPRNRLLSAGFVVG
jgi:hypothetical protein